MCYLSHNNKIAKLHYIPLIDRNRSPYIVQMGPLLKICCIPNFILFKQGIFMFLKWKKWNILRVVKMYYVKSFH